MQILPLLPSVPHSKTNDVMITADYSKNELPQSIKKGAGINDVIILYCYGGTHT
jgi:hypothetical protein